MWTKQHGFDVSANGLSATVTAQRLARIPLFADLDDATRERLAATFQSELIDHDQIVFEQGGIGDAFYVIARGVVEVLRTDESGSSHVVATLADGDFFGEMSLLSHDRRNATVQTRGVTTLLRLDQGAFDDLMATAPGAKSIVAAAAAARAEENRAT
jgi:ATP-binding cassette subfamily B protein